LLSVPLTWSVVCGPIVGQLLKFTGATKATYVLQSPVPLAGAPFESRVTKLPSWSLLEVRSPATARRSSL
jgi:hypothetical protein